MVAKGKLTESIAHTTVEQRANSRSCSMTQIIPSTVSTSSQHSRTATESIRSIDSSVMDKLTYLPPPSMDRSTKRGSSVQRSNKSKRNGHSRVTTESVRWTVDHPGIAP